MSFPPASLTVIKVIASVSVSLLDVTAFVNVLVAGIAISYLLFAK